MYREESLIFPTPKVYIWARGRNFSKSQGHFLQRREGRCIHSRILNSGCGFEKHRRRALILSKSQSPKLLQVPNSTFVSRNQAYADYYWHSEVERLTSESRAWTSIFQVGIRMSYSIWPNTKHGLVYFKSRFGQVEYDVRIPTWNIEVHARDSDVGRSISERQ